jgi:hypothetical protein
MDKAPGLLLSCIAVYLELYEIVRLELVSLAFRTELTASPRILDRILKDRLSFPEFMLDSDVTGESVKAICRELTTGSLKTLGFFIYEASSYTQEPRPQPESLSAHISSKSMLKIAHFDQVNFPLKTKGRLYPLLIDFSVTSFQVTPAASPHTIMVFSSTTSHQDTDIAAYTGLFQAAWSQIDLLEICGKMGLSCFQSFDTGVELILFQGQNAILRPLFWAHFAEVCTSIQFHLPEPVLAAHVYTLFINPSDSNSRQDWISTLRPSGKLVRI